MTGEPDEARRIVRSLSFHADYVCQNSGVCCGSGWDIAVERPIHLTLRSRLHKSQVRLPHGPDGFQPMADPPADCDVSFRIHASGSCWFRDNEASRCAVHRAFGEAALPSACRQFPRVCLLEPEQVSVSLSHYCPTAADLLFRDMEEFAIVDHPSGFPGCHSLEGLDARDSCSPLLRPRVLLGFDGLRAFEGHAVRALSRDDVWKGLATIQAAVDDISTWTPMRGDLVTQIPAAFAARDGMESFAPKAQDPRSILLASIPPGAPGNAALPDFLPVTQTFSRASDLALRRYVAARLFGAWVMFQGEGLHVVSRYLALCLNSALLFEAARPRDEPERTRFKEAVRSADLWLVHHCDPELLASNLR